MGKTNATPKIKTSLFFKQPNAHRWMSRLSTAHLFCNHFASRIWHYGHLIKAVNTTLSPRFCCKSTFTMGVDIRARALCYKRHYFMDYVPFGRVIYIYFFLLSTGGLSNRGKMTSPWQWAIVSCVCIGISIKSFQNEQMRSVFESLGQCEWVRVYPVAAVVLLFVAIFRSNPGFSWLSELN